MTKQVVMQISTCCWLSLLCSCPSAVLCMWTIAIDNADEVEVQLRFKSRNVVLHGCLLYLDLSGPHHLRPHSATTHTTPWPPILTSLSVPSV
jgi:hypothetical protein